MCVQVSCRGETRGVQLYSGYKTVSVVLTNAVASCQYSIVQLYSGYMTVSVVFHKRLFDKCQYSMQLPTHQLRQGASPGRGRQGDSSLLMRRNCETKCFYLSRCFYRCEELTLIAAEKNYGKLWESPDCLQSCLTV